MKELQELGGNKHPEFNDSNSPSQRVGGHMSPKTLKLVEHAERMYSLGNTYSEDEIQENGSDRNELKI